MTVGQTEDTMSQYLLLLYHPRTSAPVGPEDMQKALEKYMAWAKKPFATDSKRLANDAGKVIRPQAGGPRTTDGPFSETKELLGGYYMIEAASYDQAVERTLDHPHLEYGGTIEVRHVFGS